MNGIQHTAELSASFLYQVKNNFEMFFLHVNMSIKIHIDVNLKFS